MRLDDQRRSANIEDRRVAGGAQGPGRPFGGGMRLPIGRGGLGLGGLLLLLVVAWFAGFNPLQLLGLDPPVATSGTGHSAALDPRSQTESRSTPAEDAQVDMVRVVLATTEDCWGQLFPDKFGRAYEQPRLVLFRDGVRSACGFADTAVGPFYCPGDNQVYLDLAFFDDLRKELGAGGDFAQAYVIAHEVGHHVQNLIGTNRRVQALQGRASETEFHGESVNLELQADYFAGVWAHYVKARGLLEVGDYEEAIAAAHAVGDDTLQKRATGRVMPEKFTHGTAAQRQKWFRLGFETGDPTARDPFKEEK
jgi:predicted metalloprotease